MNDYRAGSAIAQGSDVGRIGKCSKWSPTDLESLWLLISGASNPPKAIHFSRRRTKSGDFLAGISHDLANVEDAIGCQLFNTVRDLYLTKSAALRHIQKLFERCEGGDLTLFVTGKIERPRTEPLYSGGTRTYFPITDGYDLAYYNDLVSCFVSNSENILASQSILDGYFCGIFTSSELNTPWVAATWSICYDFTSLSTFVEENPSKQIYSLTCDEDLGFGVFFIEYYGTCQKITTCPLEMEHLWKLGFHITACVARNSTFYFVMTKNTQEYEGKLQLWFSFKKWSQTYSVIGYWLSEGYKVTGLCYSKGLGRYFVVMTQSCKVQVVFRFDSLHLLYDDFITEEGFHPTILYETRERDNGELIQIVIMTKDETIRRSDILVSHELED
ncbi:hypothetical protein AWC38_SpisGene20084 [Stylophora pistillata]|uniref:Uncharacterized protein n=1 Tax=Stylophora pistillata TaxID=50429 RepID=A0A2B4RFV8_STYPI|nr:hypothetical protein AWC38_SpisGene20084 [Stylophora pistillata]